MKFISRICCSSLLSLSLSPFPSFPPPLLPGIDALLSSQFGDVILVTLKAAQNLVAMDVDGGYDSSDPYCIFSLGQQTCRSSVVERSLNPHWNETICFLVESSEQDMSLSVMVMDHDLGKPDDPLGSLDIPLSSVRANSPQDRFFKLEGGGFIFCSLHSLHFFVLLLHLILPTSIVEGHHPFLPFRFCFSLSWLFLFSFVSFLSIICVPLVRQCHTGKCIWSCSAQRSLPRNSGTSS